MVDSAAHNAPPQNEMITIGTVRLPKAAQEVLADLTNEEMKTVRTTAPCPYSETMGGKWKSTPKTLDLAVMISGVLQSREGESTVQNFLNYMKAKWNLSMPYLKGVRAAVQHILKAEDRAAARGSDSNVVDSDNYMDQCNYAMGRLKDDNKHEPTLFHSGGQWVEVQHKPTAVAVPLDRDTFAARLNMATSWRKAVGDGTDYRYVSCPPDVVKQLYYHTDKPVPELKGVIHAPMYDVEGRLIVSRGYDRSGYFYAPPDDLFVATPPRNITEADLAKAREKLVDILCDFELDGVSRADLEAAALRGEGEKVWRSGNDPQVMSSVPPSFLSMVGFMFEQLVRPLIDGPVMPLLISKTAPRAGGGLLASVVQQVVRGATNVRPLAANEDERRKAILSAARSGTSIIAWDNLPVRQTVDSPSMAILFTEGEITDRVLGASEEITVAVDSSFLLIGNRPPFSAELVNRLTLAELIPQTDDPKSRTGWKHAQLLPYVKENRGEILGALLVLIQNWINLGRPASKYAPVIGRFESYTGTIGGILECAAPNWTSWQGNRDKLKSVAEDDEGDNWATVFEAWAAERGLGASGKIEVHDLIEIASDAEIDLPVQRIKDSGPFAYNGRSFGKAMASMNERVFALEGYGKVMLTRHNKRSAGGVAWVLKHLPNKAVKSDPANVHAKPIIFGRSYSRHMTEDERKALTHMTQTEKADLKRILDDRKAA